MAIERSFYFYVLYCQDNTLYAGYTTDLARRLAVHNTGKGAKYTRLSSRRPLKLIYSERFATKSEAMRQEAKFKQLTRPAKEAYLKANGLKSIYTSQFILVNRVERPLNERKGEGDATN